MKIELDFSDLFCEEDSSIKEVVLDEIHSRVQRAVWEKIKGYVDEKISGAMIALIMKQVDSKIKTIVEEFVNKNEISFHNRKISIDQHINDIFNTVNSWDSLHNTVTKKAEEHAKELKARYDTVFANRIVMKIHEQGMLKDDISKLLLDK